MRVLLVLDDGIDDRDKRTAARNWSPIFHRLARGVDLGVVACRDGRYMLPAAGGGSGDRVALGWRGPASVMLSIRMLREAITQGPYDLVHAHEPRPALAVAAACVGVRRKPRTIFHRHHGYSRGRLAQASRLASFLTDRTFTVSNSARHYALQQGVPPGKVSVVPNGVVDLRSVEPGGALANKAQVGIGPEDPLVLWVGRLRAEKGLALLVDLIREIGPTMNDLHFVVVGAGPMEEDLRRWSTTWPNVHVVGHQDDVASWYAAADVVVNTSPHEACPFTVLEAMAAGRPIVAPRSDGYVDLIEDGVSGILTARDARSLASALKSVLSFGGLSDRLARGARLQYERLFSVEASVAALVSAYRDALNHYSVTNQ